MNYFPAVLDEHESLAAISHQGCDVPMIHSRSFSVFQNFSCQRLHWFWVGGDAQRQDLSAGDKQHVYEPPHRCQQRACTPAADSGQRGKKLPQLISRDLRQVFSFQPHNIRWPFLPSFSLSFPYLLFLILQASSDSLSISPFLCLPLEVHCYSLQLRSELWQEAEAESLYSASETLQIKKMKTEAEAWSIYCMLYAHIYLGTRPRKPQNKLSFPSDWWRPEGLFCFIKLPQTLWGWGGRTKLRVAAGDLLGRHTDHNQLF